MKEPQKNITKTVRKKSNKTINLLFEKIFFNETYIFQPSMRVMFVTTFSSNE